MFCGRLFFALTLTHSVTNATLRPEGNLSNRELLAVNGRTFVTDHNKERMREKRPDDRRS